MQDEELNLLDLYHSLLEEWWVIGGITLIAAITSIVVALSMTKIYRAETIVAEVQSQQQRGGAASLLGQFGGIAGIGGMDLGILGSGRGPARATLQSKNLVEEFIRRNDLLPHIYPNRWDDATDSWRTDALQPTLWWGVHDFVSYIRSVHEDARTGLITVSIEWTDPAVAADWANGVVSLANEMLRQRDQADAERNIAYLRTQIDSTTVVELQQALYRLIEAEIKTLMLADARAEYAFTVIDPAVAPESRIRPRRSVIVILGTFVGGLFGLLIAGLRQSIKRQKRKALGAA